MVGFVHLTSPEAREREVLAAFHRGLSDTGYIEGRNVALEYRWAQGQNDRLPPLVAELVRRRGIRDRCTGEHNKCACSQSCDPNDPDRFYAGRRPGPDWPRRQTQPTGGNVTGIALLVEVAGKRLELLLELVPAATSIAYLRNPTNPFLPRAKRERCR